MHNNSYSPIAQVKLKQDSEFVDLHWCERKLRIEHRWLYPERGQAPLLVFLHEGLGSVAMWKDFPQRLCAAANCRGLVYSRPGYGRSSARGTDENWDIDFMHRQACEVLPALFDALGVDCTRQPPWLYGHSDGGSIALLYAARFPHCVAGLVLAAPHIFVEEISVASIALAREAYLGQDLQSRLAKYHDDPDSAFWGWNRIWLARKFRNWSIEAEIDSIRCPVLAVQGLEDEYGSLLQIQGIARRVAHTELLVLPQCAHSPHRDQAETLMTAVTQFIHNHHRGDNS